MAQPTCFTCDDDVIPQYVPLLVVVQTRHLIFILTSTAVMLSADTIVLVITALVLLHQLPRFVQPNIIVVCEKDYIDKVAEAEVIDNGNAGVADLRRRTSPSAPRSKRHSENFELAVIFSAMYLGGLCPFFAWEAMNRGWNPLATAAYPVCTVAVIWLLPSIFSRWYTAYYQWQRIRDLTIVWRAKRGSDGANAEDTQKQK
ncbi:hypothetical protein BDZ90DRAFT_232608 [Jaminaea rosea]|uniref:Uncharacterized protein n=1 Tax=Jaminaea rosea TaxID=1569628 RepID=A0A316UP25_9BASI|nr:hypothetical protein BDZ90DRAFT_232608 [Jaminaea rosea]PWN27036.1 hypothetical protein BDZ90DRAFT_232608 [Jaminaea rosea]